MKCRICGAELSENTLFCGTCGTRVAATASSTAARPGPSYATLPRQRRSGRWLLIAVVLIVAAAAVAAYFFIPRAVSGPELLLYAIHDEGLGLPNTIAVMKPDGSENLEIARDRDGLWFGGNPYGSQRYLAPNGRWLALYGRTDEGWELTLTTIDGGAPLLIDDLAIRSAALTTLGFSPDGKYFAYTTYDETGEEVTMHVVDETGAEILSVANAAFASFFPDSRRLLVAETDDEGLFNALAWLNVDDGVLNRITDLSESSGWIRPLVSPDGEQVYFYADNELLVTDVESGAARRIHEFDSQVSSVFFSPDNHFLTIYDQFSDGQLGELSLISLADDRATRIDEDINLGAVSGHVGEWAVTFSRDGSLVAYLTDQPDNVSLYVTGTDGRNRRRISDDNAWVSFAFSPNNKQIAFIEGASQNEPGDLFIADVDGSNRLRLAVDVWSFRFVGNGRNLIYSKVKDLNRGDPESEIYRIRSNGEDQELLFGPQNGLISLLTWTE